MLLTNYEDHWPFILTFYCDIMFYSKAINPGTEVYQDTLDGTVPPIKAEEAKTLCENGYKEKLQTMILDFAEKRRSWIKQGEVYMLQFLDIVVAIPIAVFYLTQDGTSDDVKQRTALVLKYVSSCNNCLSMSKETGQPPECRWFCHLCMRYKRVFDNHAGMYTEWLCDLRPCEQCLRMNRKCLRFSTLLGISDQAAPYGKYGRSVSSSLQDCLDGHGKSDFPYRHIHDVGHHLKNAQASLERGMHFEGSYTYDSKDLWIVASTVSEGQQRFLSEGLSSRALSQLDKHSEELALQRVSQPVIDVLNSIGYCLRTDVSELYKPWTSTSSDHSSLIGTPLFLCISRRSVVFYTNDNLSGVFYFRQSPIQQKLHKISMGHLEEDNIKDLIGFSETKAKEAKWKSIAGLAVMNVYDPLKNTTKYDDILLIADTELQAIRCSLSVSLFWKSPRDTFAIYKLKIVFGSDMEEEGFYPFSVKGGLPNEKQFIVTNHVRAKIYLMQFQVSHKEAIVL